MKKLVSTLLIASAFVLSTALPASASVVSNEAWDTGFEEFYDSEGYFELVEPVGSAAIKPCRRGTIRVRNTMSTRKKLLHSAVAGGIGAAIGGGIGGKRGALIGVGSGAGGYLLYRYVKDRRGNCVRRYVGRG